MAFVFYDGVRPILSHKMSMSRRKKCSDAFIWIVIGQYTESKIPIGLSRKEDPSHFNSIRSRQCADTILKPNPNDALMPGTWRGLNPLVANAVSPLPNIQIEKCS